MFRTTPRAMAAFAQGAAVRAIQPERFSFTISTRLIAAAANANGQIKSGQVSPIRSENDFQRKYGNGANTQVQTRMTAGSCRRYPRHASNRVPPNDTGNRIGPTSAS